MIFYVGKESKAHSQMPILKKTDVRFHLIWSNLEALYFFFHVMSDIAFSIINKIRVLPMMFKMFPEKKLTGYHSSTSVHQFQNRQNADNLH